MYYDAISGESYIILILASLAVLYQFAKEGHFFKGLVMLAVTYICMFAVMAIAGSLLILVIDNFGPILIGILALAFMVSR